MSLWQAWGIFALLDTDDGATVRYSLDEIGTSFHSGWETGPVTRQGIKPPSPFTALSEPPVRRVCVNLEPARTLIYVTSWELKGNLYHRRLRGRFLRSERCDTSTLETVFACPRKKNFRQPNSTNHGVCERLFVCFLQNLILYTVISYDTNYAM